jgi:hypothetical protein
MRLKLEDGMEWKRNVEKNYVMRISRQPPQKGSRSKTTGECGIFQLLG